MGLDARKPVFWGLRTTKVQTSLRIRAVWSEPSLFAFWKVLYKQKFNFLASLCNWGDWFESRFVGYPEDRFCRIVAKFFSSMEKAGRHIWINSSSVYPFLIDKFICYSVRSNIFTLNAINNMDLFAKKAFFWVLNQVRLKPSYSSTETSFKDNGTLHVASLAILLSRLWIKKAAIKLHLCCFACNKDWLRGYKTFFMLNSIEHEISTANKH